MVSTAVGDNLEMEWHNDGHTIALSLNKSQVEIVEVICPSENGGACESDSRSNLSPDGLGCIVQYFIRRFGVECNIGQCPPEETMEICWTLVGNKNDPDASQLWFVPVNDEVFYAWMSSHQNDDQS